MCPLSMNQTFKAAKAQQILDVLRDAELLAAHQPSTRLQSQAYISWRCLDSSRIHY
jgi:hypothetical protein